MADQDLRAMLSAALDRLSAEQTAKIDAAHLPADSPLRTAVRTAIDTLRDRLESDPGFVEDALHDILNNHPTP